MGNTSDDGKFSKEGIEQRLGKREAAVLNGAVRRDCRNSAPHRSALMSPPSVQSLEGVIEHLIGKPKGTCLPASLL